MNAEQEDPVDTHIYVKMPDNLRRRLYGDTEIQGSNSPDKENTGAEPIPGEARSEETKEEKTSCGCCSWY